MSRTDFKIFPEELNGALTAEHTKGPPSSAPRRPGITHASHQGRMCPAPGAQDQSTGGPIPPPCDVPSCARPPLELATTPRTLQFGRLSWATWRGTVPTRPMDAGTRLFLHGSSKLPFL